MSREEYEITYTINRKTDDDDDLVEIGFGSSGTWDDLEAAAYAMESDIANRNWETSEGMPDPSEIGDPS